MFFNDGLGCSRSQEGSLQVKCFLGFAGLKYQWHSQYVAHNVEMVCFMHYLAFFSEIQQKIMCVVQMKKIRCKELQIKRPPPF